MDTIDNAVSADLWARGGRGGDLGRGQGTNQETIWRPRKEVVSPAVSSVPMSHVPLQSDGDQGSTVYIPTKFPVASIVLHMHM